MRWWSDGAGVSTNLTLAEPEEWTGWRELSAEIPHRG